MVNLAITPLDMLLRTLAVAPPYFSSESIALVDKLSLFHIPPFLACTLKLLGLSLSEGNDLSIAFRYTKLVKQ